MQHTVKVPIVAVGTVFLSILLTGCGATASVESKATPAATSIAEPAATEIPVVDDAAGLTPAKTLENLLNAALAADAADVMEIRSTLSESSTEDEFALANGYLAHLIPELESLSIFFPDAAALAQEQSSTYGAYFPFLLLTQMANDTYLTVEVPDSAVTITGTTATIVPANFVYSGDDVAALNSVEQALGSLVAFPLVSIDGTWSITDGE
ncbi:hypothetical protein [Cryobacterium sp. Y57]|uniref:hypothetical protein n=1 Tax=Cryobacterium sp. Y57 TaxID=2048287 RepID=UPI000CE534B6|nr:hypothetical protein [Cryobacterium sp. Y57]